MNIDLSKIKKRNIGIILYFAIKFVTAQWPELIAENAIDSLEMMVDIIFGIGFVNSVGRDAVKKINTNIKNKAK